ncbi:MAG: TlpA family protein disulfide reductase [Kaistella sp.]|nr:TlpA family protein disulfide reductase [Kaistella sp.]
MKNYLTIFITSAFILGLVFFVNQYTKPDLKSYPTRDLVYINVWEEWCKPCIAELPELQKLEDRYVTVKFFLLSDSKDTEQAKNLLKKLKIDGFKEIYDSEKQTEIGGIFSGSDVGVVPKHIIINDGKVVYKSVGSGPEIIKEIEKVFRENHAVMVESTGKDSVSVKKEVF